METERHERIIKRVSWLLLLALIVLPIYECSQPQRMYLKFGKDEYGSYIVEVPYDIVKSQDCTAFKEWAKKDNGAFFAQDSCPWAKPIVSGPIGRFRVNGVKLNVPRKYLFFDNKYRQTSDGEHSTLFLGFIYPDITPLTSEDWSKINKYEVDLQIKEAVCAENQKLCNGSLHIYRQSTDSTEDKISGVQPRLIRKDKELNMDFYAWKDEFGEVERFSRGDKWNPDYWMMCGAVMCEAYINYANKRVYVWYTFKVETLMEKHDELRAKIVSLLDEWSEDDE